VNRLSRCARGYDLLQEGDEFPTVMAGSGFAVHTTSGGIERRIQAECSVPVVLEAVTLGASRRERQGRDRDGPRLEWRSSRQCRTRPRVGAGADKGREYRPLCFRTRDRHGQMPFQAVRLQAGFLPNPMHGVFTDAQRRGQLATAPVRRRVARPSPRSGQSTRDTKQKIWRTISSRSAVRRSTLLSAVTPARNSCPTGRSRRRNLPAIQ
jgi:hypothetical protein